MSIPTYTWHSSHLLTMQVIDDEKENPGQMAYAYKMTWIWAITLSIMIFVLWPLLALPAGIFSRDYFTFWVIISMVKRPSRCQKAISKLCMPISITWPTASMQLPCGGRF